MSIYARLLISPTQRDLLRGGILGPWRHPWFSGCYALASNRPVVPVVCIGNTREDQDRMQDKRKAILKSALKRLDYRELHIERGFEETSSIQEIKTLGFD